MQSPGVNPVPPRSTTSVYVRTDGRTIRVNPQGTYAQTGGIDGHRLVLQVTRAGQSRLALYSLTSRKPRYLVADRDIMVISARGGDHSCCHG